MSANLDRSLDEVISSRRTVRRGGRRGVSAKSNIIGRPARPRVPSTAMAVDQAATPQVSDKIIVSNLPIDVNENQIRELFNQMIGPLRDVTLTYDSRGTSKGIASVVFARKGDATKAYAQYHDRLIDGSRPMKIEIVVDPRKAPNSLVARMGNPVQNGMNGSAVRTGTGGFGGRRGGGGGGGGGGGRGRGRGGGRRQNDRPVKSLEDLDAEMEDYLSTAPAATTTAA